jgi:hypothetical protein
MGCIARLVLRGWFELHNLLVMHVKCTTASSLKRDVDNSCRTNTFAALLARTAHYFGECENEIVLVVVDKRWWWPGVPPTALQ